MNRLHLRGVLVQLDPLRYSPAGVPIAEAVIQHRSTQNVAGQARQVECELTVQASGALAAQLSSLAPGSAVELEGVINRRSVSSRQLILLVNRIEKE